MCLTVLQLTTKVNTYHGVLRQPLQYIRL